MYGIFNVPTAVNEPIKSYAPGTTDRAMLKAALEEARSQKIDAPMYIDGKEVRTSKKKNYHHHMIISIYLDSTAKEMPLM